MSFSSRYFENYMPDYDGTEVIIDKNLIRSRVMDTLQKILRNQELSSSACEGGLYVGLAGVAYAFYYAAAFYEQSDQNNIELMKYALSCLQLALNHVRPSHSEHDPGQTVGFLLGDAGVYAVAAVIYTYRGITHDAEKMLQSYAQVAKLSLHPRNADEMLVGRAGYLCGLQFLRKVLRVDVIDHDMLNAICSTMISSGRDYMKRQQLSLPPLMYAYYETEYLGAAHGLSGILQMLLGVPDFLKSNPDVESQVKQSVDYLLQLQHENGNFPCATDEVHSGHYDQPKLLHWCHGAPGVVYLMAKAYLYWHEEKYLESCLKCGEVTWVKGLLKKGPGICHGVAGNGYVFLLLYRLTQDKKHLYRALRFADFMYTEQFQKEARIPDRPYSLYEGLAGTACFLADLLDPDRAEFPFFNVF